MKIILFDDKSWGTLRPLTFTRPISELRVGILTIREKWEKRFGDKVAYLTKDYLQEKFPLSVEDDNLLINSSVCPNDELVQKIRSLQTGEMLLQGDCLIAVRMGIQDVATFDPMTVPDFTRKEYTGEFTRVVYPYHLFSLNAQELEVDFRLITEGRESALLNSCVQVYGEHPVFVEEGAVVRCAVINTEGGPVYIGKDAEIMEGVLVRGPLAMCEHSVLTMGAKVYGATTLGPYCKCGGEVNNVVMILSDDATQTELTLAGRIMAMLGAGSTPYGLLKVIRAENFQAAAYGNSNLIVVGLSDQNNVFKQINPYLHFQYTDDMTSLAESTKLVMTTDYAHEASVLQLMKSPYNETMALLTASAATEAGLQNLMARLSTEKNRWSLGKEALVVDGYGGASSYQFTVSTALTQNAEKPSFADVIVQNREPMTLLLVGMGCMLVLLLAAVLLLVRIHHRRKYDDK